MPPLLTARNLPTAPAQCLLVRYSILRSSKLYNALALSPRH